MSILLIILDICCIISIYIKEIKIAIRDTDMYFPTRQSRKLTTILCKYIFCCYIETSVVILYKVDLH